MDISVDWMGYWDTALALHPIWSMVLGVFGFSWGVQLYFWLGRFARVAHYKAELEPVEPEAFLPISVIVCCHNDLPGIQALLPMLKQQRYPTYELILVDDRSDDETYDWLLVQSRKADAGFRLVRVNERPDHIAGKKYALTLGIKAARYDAVLLTDADCLTTSPHWISRMAAGLQNGDKQVVLGYSPYRQRPGVLNTLIRYDAFYTALQYLGFALAGKPYMGVGRNLGYRKSLFFDTKGFFSHAGKTGGDDDLFINQAVHEQQAKGFALCLHGDAQTLSEPKNTLGSWFIQKRRHLSAGRSYHTSDKLALGLLQGSHVLFYATGIALLFAWPLGMLAALGYVIRLILTWVLQYRAARTLGETFAPISLPLLDAWMPLHYLFFGLPAMLTRKVAWA